MGEARQIMETVIKHAFEIVYLLTGESYIVVKIKDEHSPFVAKSIYGPPSAVFAWEKTDNKSLIINTIVNHASNIIHLMNGEMPVRYDSVAVYFSIEEWQYLKEHKDQYKSVIENCQTVSTSGNCQIIDEDCEDATHSTVESAGPFVIRDEEKPKANYVALPSKDGLFESGEDPMRNSTINQPECEGHTILTTEIQDLNQSETQQCVLDSHKIINNNDKNILQENKEHICSECGKGFDNKRHFNNHLRNHRGEKPFICGMCGKAFSCNFHLIVHIRSHTGEKPFVCSDCGKGFTSRSAMLFHQKSQTGGFICSICGKSLICRLGLARHRLIHTGDRPLAGSHIGQKMMHSTEKSFVCKECGKCYKNRSSLYVHKKIHHDIRPCDSGHEDQHIGHKWMYSSEKPFLCKECGKCYKNRSSLYTHKTKHAHLRPFECNICSKRFSTDSRLELHMNKHTAEKPYICSECGKEFCQSSELVKHMRLHMGDTSYAASECGKDYTINENTITQEKSNTGTCQMGDDGNNTYHTSVISEGTHITNKEEEPISNDVAPLSNECLLENGDSDRQDPLNISTDNSLSPSKFETHNLITNQTQDLNHQETESASDAYENDKNILAEQKEHVCSECGKGFDNKRHFNNHLRNHRGEKPYSCGTCGKAFSCNSLLVVHNRTHTGERPFECGYCGKGFISRSSLLYHQKSHTCSVCGKSFTCHVALSKHRLTHAGDRPIASFEHEKQHLGHRRIHSSEKAFVCKECGKCYKNRSSLSTHKKMHSNMRPFCCTICPKTFSSSSRLVLHARLHIAKEPYTCSECGSKFCQSSELAEHIKSHMGDMTCVGSNCANDSTIHENLVDQQRINTGTCLTGDDGKEHSTPVSPEDCFIDETFVARAEEPEAKYVARPTNDSFFQSGESHKQDPFKLSTYSSLSQFEYETNNLIVNQIEDLNHLQEKRCESNPHEVGINNDKNILAEQKEHVCSECGKGFDNKRHFNNHLRNHRGEKPFVCGTCGKAFSCNSHLVIHHRTHTGERPFVCSDCGKGFISRSTLHNHNKIQTGEFTCTICGKAFHCRLAFANHSLIHTGDQPLAGSHLGHKPIHSPEESFVCKECGKCYKNRSSLRVHKKIHCNMRPFVCFVCSKSFSSNSHLVLHMRLHTAEEPYTCSECGREFFQISEFVEHMRSHMAEAPYVFSDYGNDFTIYASLTSHRRSDPGNLSSGDDNTKNESNSAPSLDAVLDEGEVKRLYVTGKEEGPKSTPSNEGLYKNGDDDSLCVSETNHKQQPLINTTNNTIIPPKYERDNFTRKQNQTEKQLSSRTCSNSILAEQKEHVCSECGKGFNNKRHFNNHLRNHRGDKPFPCGSCGKAFSCNSHLETHMRIHTGERPFVCTYCGKGFIKRYFLNSHQRTHTGEKPYVCIDCGKSFTVRSSLLNHHKTHKGQFTCLECGKSFNSSTVLGLHKLIHTADKSS
ncbi:zinc finger protein 585B-like [Bombina bombina]|uniref:zinc finger protein 585B-like n=1 Tax=Bombina bombina TaxID=8345 RepID=UPI00235A9B2D|nr:zinc finger protein 585B-like [Bombina bombina]